MGMTERFGGDRSVCSIRLQKQPNAEWNLGLGHRNGNPEQTRD